VKRALFLVLYDIFDKTRLREISKVVYQYRYEGQKSAIEASLTQKERSQLMKTLERLSDEEDKINLVCVVGEPILLGKALHVTYVENGVIIV